MASISDVVVLVHPTVSGTDVIVSDQIWVLFNREIDETSVKDNFFVAGPDQDTWSGPDLLLFHNRVEQGDESDILQSPDYHGLVQGTFSFEKINPGSYETYVGYDYTGAGNIWRSKAIFTPTNRLTPETTYYVYLSGDEDSSDTLQTGISSRTIFDVTKGANLGTGNISFTGTYTGTADDTLNIRIYTAGEVGTAKFVWWRSSAPLLTFGPYPMAMAPTLLVDGVKLICDSGTFEVGDTFAVIIKVRDIFTGNIIWPFETGSGSIVVLPDTTSTTVIGTPAGATTSTSFLTVEETTPDDQATNLDILNQDYDIVIDFSTSLDPASVTASRIAVEIDPVNGDENILHSGIFTAFTFSVSGDLLTITIPSGILNYNNVVTITLDELISSTSGITLEEDYDFYFTTLYNPLYSSVRKVRLEYGALLSNVPDDTINLAVFEASLNADMITWRPPTADNTWYAWVRREFTTCKAAEILIMNIANLSGGLKAKQLGDLKVEYDTKMLNSALDKAVGCLGKWEATMNGGGYGVQTAVGVVKGDYDIDKPPIGRGWNQPSDTYQRYYPVAVSKSLGSTSRRWISGYYSNSRGRSGKGNTH